MKKSDMSLKDIISMQPEYHISKRTVEIASPLSHLSESLKDFGSFGSDREGILSRDDRGRVLVIPCGHGRRAKIIAEAVSAETAAELCDITAKKLTYANCMYQDN